MNLQRSVQNIYKNPATLDDDLNLSGLKKSWHEYRLDNQTPQLFDYLKQLWLFEDNLHRRTVYRHQDQQFYLQEPLQRHHRSLTRELNSLFIDTLYLNLHRHLHLTRNECKKIWLNILITARQCKNKAACNTACS